MFVCSLWLAKICKDYEFTGMNLHGLLQYLSLWPKLLFQKSYGVYPCRHLWGLVRYHKSFYFTHKFNRWKHSKKVSVQRFDTCVLCSVDKDGAAPGTSAARHAHHQHAARSHCRFVHFINLSCICSVSLWIVIMFYLNCEKYKYT